MIKTLSNLTKQDKEKFKVPKKIQQIIPIDTIYNDGIFQVGKNKFSITYKFTDINYAVASREDKEAMFLEYSELLNSFDSGATTKITISLRRLNKENFEKEILLPLMNDELDQYRKEYNQMLLDKAMGTNGMIREMYLTVSIFRKNYEDAKVYFRRVTTDMTAHLARLDSKCKVLNAVERLQILHDFYRTGEEMFFNIDLKQLMKKGHDFKDYICPDSFEFKKDYFTMGTRYGRVLFLKEYASYIKDSMIAELTDMNHNLMMSIDVIPVPTDEAVREVENRLLGVETNITNWQRRQNASNNFSAVIPYDMEQQRKEAKEFLDDLTTRDQRMMFAVLTFVLTADSLEQLEADSETLLTTARKHLCQMAPLNFQQMDGLNTALPIGLRKINALRTLTTESLAVLNPFRVQEIMDKDGIYYGENASPDLALKFGDKLMVVGEKDGIKGVARLLGNDTKQLSDTDFFPIALGIVLGVLFGKLNISFSDSLSFSPGLTGGILMVALFLSAIGKTGPILWSMSGPANQLLRQLGLLLFLAEVGTSAGRNLMATFQESGWLLFGVGAAITLVPMLVAVCVGLFVFKINILDLLGTITGGMTSTPGLAAADSMTDSNIPSVAYATVYPIAMVFLILIIQVIASAVY